MKKENETIIFENRKEVEMIKTVIDIAACGNLLTLEERKLSYDLSKMLDMIYVSEE